MRRKPRDRQWRSTQNMRAQRKHNSLSQIMESMSENNLHPHKSHEKGRRQPRRRPRPSSASSSSTTALLSHSPPPVTAEQEHAYNSDPMFRQGETVSLNRQRLRVAELLKLCRNQDHNCLAPSFQPISGLSQKQFRTRQSKLEAIRKIQLRSAKDVQKLALPPKYQPTRSMTLALERATEEELPQTVSAALVSLNSIGGRLHDLLGETTLPSSSLSGGNSGIQLKELPGNPLNNSARDKHAELNKNAMSSMTDGILQNSYLVERFLKELELVGQFEGSGGGGGGGSGSGGSSSIDNDPTVVSALRHEIEFLVVQLGQKTHDHSLLKMENDQLKSRAAKSGGIQNSFNRGGGRSGLRSGGISGGSGSGSGSGSESGSGSRSSGGSNSSGGSGSSSGGSSGSSGSGKASKMIAAATEAADDGSGSNSGSSVDTQHHEDQKLRKATKKTKRRASISAGQMVVTKKKNTNSSQVSLTSGDVSTSKTNTGLTEREGKLIFEMDETKREWSKRLLKKNAEMKRTSALMMAADVERKHLEDQLKKAQHRIAYAEDKDLDSLVRSMQEQLANEKNKFSDAVYLLERERTQRSVGSVKTVATQTGFEVIPVGCQTDLSGSVGRSSSSSLSFEKDDDEDEAAIVVRKRKKQKKSYTNGAQWAKAIAYWDGKMEGYSGLLHFAKNYKIKDVQTHSMARVMLLLRNIMEDKIGGDAHEQEIPLQEYISEWCLHKYGLQSIATKEHAKLLISVRATFHEHTRIALFARMAGINRPLPTIVTNFVLYLWGLLRPNFDATNKEREKYDQTAYIATTYCVEAVEQVFNVNRPSCSYCLRERQRSKLVKRIWTLSKNPNTRKSHGRQMLPVSEVVELFVSEWETESIRLDQLYRALFEASDVNGDQELTLAEFRSMIHFVEHATKQATKTMRPVGVGSPVTSPVGSPMASPKSSSPKSSSPTSFSRTFLQDNTNVVQLYQHACQSSAALSDVQLPPDQMTPQGFAVAMQSTYRGRSVPPVLTSVPVIAEDLLRKAVQERWIVARPDAVNRVEQLSVSGGGGEEEGDEKEFLVNIIHRIDDMVEYPKEEHLQASWIAMDMLQNWTFFCEKKYTCNK